MTATTRSTFGREVETRDGIRSRKTWEPSCTQEGILRTHHSNVDRLWTVWKSLPPESDEATRSGSRARKESDDPDFLNAKFAFYDHKGEIVHVKVSQTLSTEDLSYKYEIMESDKDWINFEFQTVDEAKPSPEDISRYAETPAVFKKDESATFRLLRGEPVPFGRLAADEVEEILVIKGVKTPMRSFMAYKVFINLPDADPSTKLDTHNFVGMITNLPHNMSKAHSSSGVDFRLSIGASLKGLGPVSVTFVPAGQNEDAGFDGLEIKFN